MKKVIAFAGSPRRDGHSWTLLGQLAKGVESAGGSIKIYDLNSPGLRGCQGCNTCRTRPGCVVDDMLRPAYDDIAWADAVVIAAPIYFADIGGQTKLWLDRMFPMLDGATRSPRNPGKKAVTIISQGDANPARFDPAIQRLHGFLRVFGWKLEGSLVCHGAGAAERTIPATLMSEALRLGRQLAG